MGSLFKVGLAGLACMLGGLLFSFYFIGLNPFLAAISPALDRDSISTFKMLLTCISAVCLAGGPLGLLGLRAAEQCRRRVLESFGAGIALLGLVSYIVGSLLIYNFSGRALHLFMPGGSVLLTVGMLFLGYATLSARKLTGWGAAMPALTALYFPLQFPIQAIFFLGKGRGPNPTLLGAWGFVWFLLGLAIWSQVRSIRITESVAPPHGDRHMSYQEQPVRNSLT